MTTYVKFVENNDWEGEEWTFWLQRDGNEQELQTLANIINAFRAEEDDDTYEMNLHDTQTEAEVDLLCRYADDGYLPEHNKVTGQLKLPDGFTIETEDDPLYKGGVRDLFQ